MSKKKKFLIGVLVILLLAGLAIGILLTRSQVAARARTVTLTNGRVVEFLGTSVGDAPFTTDSKWERFARKTLPAFMGGWIPAQIVAGYTPGSNTLSVFLKFKHSNVTSPFVLEAEDATGFRYPWDGTVSKFFPEAGVAVNCLTFHSFPRRDAEFVVHIMDAQTRADLGGFPVRNQAWREYPIWHPTGLPITLTNGPIALTLAGLVRHRSGNSRFLVPEWGLEPSDPAWKNPEVFPATIEDATGNEGQILSPGEWAWRIRTTVRRQPDEFSAEEKFVVTNVAVLRQPPAPVVIEQSADRAGVHLDILRLEFFNRSDGYHSLFVRARNLRPNEDLLFHITKEQGQVIEVMRVESTPQADGSRVYRAGLARFNGAKTITIEVMVNQSLPFEFFVSPRDPWLTDH